MEKFDMQEYLKNPSRSLVLEHYNKSLNEFWPIEQSQIVLGERLAILVPETGYDTDTIALVDDSGEVRDVDGNPVGYVRFGKCRLVREDKEPTSAEESHRVITSFGELAEAAFVLAPGDGIDFCCKEDDYGWNISKINHLDTDLIIMGIYGGGHSYMYDLTGDDGSEELKAFIQEKLEYYTDNYVVYVEQREPARYYNPAQLNELIQSELSRGCKYLFIYRNKEEMTEVLDGKIYAISDTDGKHLCDILEEDYSRLLDKCAIINEGEADVDVPYFSDWVVASPEYRSRVLACRLAILFTEKYS